MHLAKRVEQGLRYLVLNGLAQAVFALGFGTRDSVALALAQVLVLGLTSSFVLTAFLPLVGSRLSMTRDDWLGVGRKRPIETIALLFGIAGLVGLPPAFSAVSVQKIMEIDSPWSPVLLVNVILAGIYLCRLAAWAFQRGHDSLENGAKPVSWARVFWLGFQFALLLGVGILWQPLYKYGFFSNRGVFGEL
jgi:formate hydrogenlyase subunit 3/multisubunit Na+/H+ antiporter MnhD subunit